MIHIRAFKIILICLLSVILSCASTGASANQLYFEAESCYRELQQHPTRQKYRSYWFKCIEQFEKVHSADPKGPWAAAGLYQAANLYQQLYKHSYRKADLYEAAARFRKVVDQYPGSAYKNKALAALEKIAPGSKSSSNTSKEDKSNKSAEDFAKNAYLKAESCYRKLRQSPEKQKFRSYWINCIEQFEQVWAKDPEGPWAAAGLFMTAHLYEDLYAHSHNPEDSSRARALYEQVAGKYPSSAYSKRARQALGTSSGYEEQNFSRVADEEETASGEMTSDHGVQTPAPGPGEAATVTGIRYWSNPDYTRVVIDSNQAADFQHNLLNKDPSINQMHKRLYVDLSNSRLANNIEDQIPINDTLLKDVRAGQYDSDTVRVVVDIKSFENYNVFSLNNPFRIVIDVRGRSAAQADPGPGGPDFFSDKNASIARQLALGVRRIVVDPGHGGKDYGAPGYRKGVHEKDVVLDISKKLAAHLEKELACEVLMTRRDDRYLTLEERTAIANTKKADLFISVHANAARNRNAYGIETYFLNLTTDEESIAVAARENATSEKNISELQTILNDLMRNAKVNESSRLATYVQNDLCGYLDRHYSQIYDKGVKQAPFYVLLGAQMPSILIETSFISNSRECKRLTDFQYQEHLCRGIVNGVRRYIQETRPTAFLAPEGN